MGELEGGEEKLDYEDETVTSDTKETKPIKVLVSNLSKDVEIEQFRNELREKGFDFETINKKDDGFEIDAGEKASQLIEQFHNQKLLDTVVKVEKVDENRRKRSRTSSISSSMSKDSKKVCEFVFLVK